MTFNRLGVLFALGVVSAAFFAGCSNSPTTPQTRRSAVISSTATPQFDATDSKYSAAED